MSDVSIGDAVTSAKGFKDNYKMAASDFNSFGGLANNTGSSVKQSGHIMNMLDKAMETGQAVDISQLTAGLSSLSNTAKRHGGTLVSIDFMQKLGQYFGLPREVYLRIIQKMKTAKVRYVIIPKSEAELSNENAGSFGSVAGKSFVEGRVVRAIGGSVVGSGVATVKSAKEEWRNGNYLTAFATWGGGVADLLTGGGYSSVVRGVSSEIRKLAHDGYTVKMVELGDP